MLLCKLMIYLFARSAPPVLLVRIRVYTVDSWTFYIHYYTSIVFQYLALTLMPSCWHKCIT